MKKGIIGILLFLLISVPVMAKASDYSLVEYKNQLYYEDRFNDDEFRLELDTSKNEVYKEEFTIHNNSKHKQQLFLYLESKAENGSYNDIMDYLTVKITRDDKEIYHGNASGMDYATEQKDLNDFLPLGELDVKGEASYTIEYSLRSDYLAVSQNKFAYIYSSFYKQKKNDMIVIEGIAPETLYNFLDVWIFCGVCVLGAILVLSIIYKKRHPKKKKEEDENKEKEEKK